MVTLPLIMISYAQSTGGLLGAGNAGLWVGAFAWIAAILGLIRGTHAVTRPRLLGVDSGSQPARARSGGDSHRHSDVK